MVEYLSGERIQGSSTLTTTPPQTSWKEIGRYPANTAGGTVSSMPVTSLPNKPNLMYLSYYTSNYDGQRIKMNSDGDDNYSWRFSTNGATDQTEIDEANIMGGYGGNGLQEFNVGFITNNLNQEKLTQTWVNSYGGSGAGNAPNRREVVGKWADTTEVIDELDFPPASSTFAAGAEVVVLGYDPSESGGTNFWQQLAYEPLTSSASEITATITAKKYLMYEFQALSSGASNGLDNVSFRFNGTGNSDNDYAYRFSDNYASDGSPITSTNFLRFRSGGATAQDFFGYGFILNASNREKLIHSRMTMNGGDGASANPRSASMAGKWASNDQITEIKLREDSSSGAFLAGSYLRIWGAD